MTTAEDLETFEDFFLHAAVPFAVSTANGEILIANQALGALVDGPASDIAAVLGSEQDAARILTELDAADSVLRDISHSAGTSLRGGLEIVVDVAPQRDADGRLLHAHWCFRPVLEGAIPQAPTVGGAQHPADAQEWIDRLERSTVANGFGDETDHDRLDARAGLVRAFFDHAPPAIHLVGPSGAVLAANPTELAILGFAEFPDRYVGQHIAQVYPDPLTIEDLLTQMSSGTPTVNVRACLQNTTGDVLSVVVFSSSRIVDNAFRNTRCIVFPDAAANPRPTPLRMFDWPSAS